MEFGVPKDQKFNEHRVGLNPFGVSRLTNLGHTVWVESGAGTDSHFDDEDFVEAGGQIVYNTDEIHQRSDVICRVRSLDADDVEALRPGAIVGAFHHLAVARKGVLEGLMERGVTAIGYEIIRDDAAGNRPILLSQSQIAGRMAVHTAAHYLEHQSGGRGIILGGVPGTGPATVVILGAGTVGLTAARVAAACGAHVIILGLSLARLQRATELIPHRIVTAIASQRNLERFTAFADVLIGSVLIPGGRAPFLVPESMVEGMKAGSVIIDVSIDQGGCVETSRPTTTDDPTYTVHDVIHYCVPNMTTNAPRTSSRLVSLGALPYLRNIARYGLDDALRADPGLAGGVYLYKGKLVNELTAAALDLPFEPLEKLLAK